MNFAFEPISGERYHILDWLIFSNTKADVVDIGHRLIILRVHSVNYTTNECIIDEYSTAAVNFEPVIIAQTIIDFFQFCR